jgi:hypothetical protein
MAVLVNGLSFYTLPWTLPGATREWSVARRFPGRGKRLGEGERDQHGALFIGEAREYSAVLPTMDLIRWVGGYASDHIHC